MEAVINVIEVAAELAEEALRTKTEMEMSMSGLQIQEGDVDLALYKNPNATELIYRDEVQEEYNDLYEYYFSFLTDRML